MELIKSARLTTFGLYNLRDDLGQNRDLARQQSERLEHLGDRLRALYREVSAEGPTWNVPADRKQP